MKESDVDHVVEFPNPICRTYAEVVLQDERSTQDEQYQKEEVAAVVVAAEVVLEVVVKKLLMLLSHHHSKLYEAFPHSSSSASVSSSYYQHFSWLVGFLNGREEETMYEQELCQDFKLVNESPLLAK